MNVRGAAIISLLFCFVLLWSGVVEAAPINGKMYQLRQPDGSKVQVRVWGDEFYQRVESLDGYTLIRNADGWICYAEVPSCEDEFVATDIVYHGKKLAEDAMTQTKVKEKKAIKEGLKLSKEARLAKHTQKMKQFGFDQVLQPSYASADGSSISLVSPGVPLDTDPLLGEVKGLTIIVEFPDEKGSISAEEVGNFCNEVGYTGFGNNGSVRDFYSDVSDGKLDYSNFVEGYYTAKNNKSYYDNPSRDAGDAGRELLGEALEWLSGQGFDFSQLTVDSANQALAVNLFYAGQVESGWTLGLWPHSGYYGDFTKDGVTVGRYQITDMGSELQIGTFCHENGHMICHWPDLYDYGYESQGVGMYCLMAAGNFDGTNPIPPNAYFRDIKGWETVTEITEGTGPTYYHTANSISSFRYSNPANPKEFFYIESRLQSGRNSSLPDAGLVIWHVDEDGDNDNEQMTPALHYRVSLEQADGRFDLEHGSNYGDSGDLFVQGQAFNGGTVPNSDWWNDSSSNLDLIVISTGGAISSFTTSDTLSPKPNPMEWAVEPNAVGLQTIYMEAAHATDSSGVEYYIDGETDPANFDDVTYGDTTLDSGWVSQTLYYRGGYAEGQDYYFRVKARDLSNNHNETEWSVVRMTTTASGSDTLPPYPNPAAFAGAPRKITNTMISMEGAAAYDEIGTSVEYLFECVSTDDPKYLDPNDVDYIGDKSLLNSSWQSDARYTVGGLTVSQPGYEYVFRVKIRDAAGNETEWSAPRGVIMAPTAVVRYVPSTQYMSIQSAINAANHGDTVVVHPGLHGESNIDFKGKKITVRSENPEDPAIVAGTVIDCNGEIYDPDYTSTSPRRAFVFQNGEGRDSVIAGFTIKNGFAVQWPQSLPDPIAVGADANAIDALGGAIVCGVVEFEREGSLTAPAGVHINSHTPASPTIRNCVFEDCYAYGQDGYNGKNGDAAGKDSPGNDGGPGMDGGHGKGGAIYCVQGSAPLIKECTFTRCFAIGGIGGDGGNASNGGTASDGAPGQPGGDGGRGGWGGNAWGGTLYFEPNCLPELYDVTISDGYARVGQPGSGGNAGHGSAAKAGNGGDGGRGGDSGDLRAAEVAGGAIYFGDGTVVTMVRTAVSNSHTDADISGQYRGGDGGNGGAGGDASNGGNGGNGGDCLGGPGHWLNDIGGAWAIAGDGGNGGAAGANGGAQGAGGNGGGLFADQRGNRGTGNPNGLNGFLVLPPADNFHALQTYAGANYYGLMVNVTATDCSISNNYAFTDIGGGELFMGQNNALYTDCAIQGNTTFYTKNGEPWYAGAGGGVCMLDPNSFAYVDCTISGNSSYHGGGLFFAAATPGANLTLTGCTVSGNEANIDYQSGFGGGIYAGNPGDAGNVIAGIISVPYAVTLTDCTIEGNVAPYGGGLCTDAVLLTVTDSRVENNLAEYGSGLYFNACDTTILGTDFAGNTAGDTAAEFAESPNAYCSGAGFYSLNSMLEVVNSTFIGDSAVGFGGSAFVTGPAPDYSLQRMVNCLFAENSAGLEGGALAAMTYAEMELVNTTFVGNTVQNTQIGAGGALICYDSFVDVTNSILWDNLSVMGPQIAVGEPFEYVQEYDPDYIPYSTLFIDYSDVDGGRPDAFVGDGDGPWLWYGSHNLNADPLFAPVGGAASTYYLSQVFEGGQLATSPCVDAGTGTAMALSAELGFDATTRTDHLADSNGVDMGYHYDSTLPVQKYILETRVIVRDRFPHGQLVVTTSPDNLVMVYDAETSHATYRFKQGAEVELQAIPDQNYRVAQWFGTDNPFNLTNTATVVMDVLRFVQVEFELAVSKNLYVPDSYATVEEAVLMAHSGDRVILSPRPGDPYLISKRDGINFGGKDVLVTSMDPNDPEIVAATVIDCQGSSAMAKRAFHFDSGEGAGAIIQGITIQNAFTAEIGLPASVDTGRWPWWNGPDPEAWDEGTPKPNPLPPFRALSGEDAVGDSYGGAILIENGSSPVIRNCVFKNCTVAGGIGGAGADGYWQNTGGTKPSGKWDGVSGGHGGDGYGSGYGGAIAVLTGSAPTIVNCQFLGNRATGGWGGEAGNGGDAGGDGRFSWGGDAGNGYGDGRGGAIFVDAGCDPLISANLFMNNFAGAGSAPENGGNPGSGAEYIAPYTLGARGAEYLRYGSGGTAISYGTNAGGAIFYGEFADSVLNDCEFEANISTLGSAVYADPNVTLAIEDCNFINHDGGAVYVASAADLAVTRCLFQANSGSQIAGAVTVAADAVSVVIADCNFVGNSTLGNGGAIQTRSDITITNSLFQANTASGYGGGFYAYLTPDPYTNTLLVEITGCEFNGNSAAEYGGAGYAKNCILEISDTDLFYNTAASGGAVQIALGDLTLERCLFFGNKAAGSNVDGFGGAVHIADGPFRIADCRFETNQARGQMSAGGAVRVIGAQPYYEQLLTNSLFATNVAENTGGAIACTQFVELEIEHCTIADNVSLSNQAGGIALDYGSTVALSHSIVSGTHGYGIFEKATNCQSLVSDTLFYGNADGDLFDVQAGQAISGAADLTAMAGYTGVLDSDPDFERGPWGEYYLAPASPAVSADLGYRYDLPVEDVLYQLTASIYQEHTINPRGTVAPTSGSYLRRSVVHVTATPRVESDELKFRVARWFGTDDDTSRRQVSSILMWQDRAVQVEFEADAPRNLYVPESYDTLQDAFSVARDGDTIILAPNPSEPYRVNNTVGFDLNGLKNIRITSTDPNDPMVVAATVIDCGGSRYVAQRAFLFDNGEGPDVVVEGLTIRNAFTAVIGGSAVISTGRWPWTDAWENSPPNPLPPSRALSGEDATGDSYGGAILCTNGSSPTIRKCVFENCRVAGGIGGDGADGYPPNDLTNVTDDLDAQSGGHSGKGIGNGYGGAIAVIDGSSPTITDCQFVNNEASGGWGGIPGDAGTAYNNGRYGWGGNDYSGLSYAAQYTAALYLDSTGGIDPFYYYWYGEGLPETNDWYEAGNGEGDGRGGAIYIDLGCRPTIANCTFANNVARPGYVSAGGKQSVNGKDFPDPFDADPWGKAGARDGSDGILIDYGTVAGGAVFFASDANSVLTGCIFAGNSAYDKITVSDTKQATRGGAIYADPNAVITIEACTFEANFAGAIYQSENAVLNVLDSIFKNNQSVIVEGGTQSLLDTFNSDNYNSLAEIYENPFVTYKLGGALTVERGCPEPTFVSGCQFSGNHTHNGGGAIYTESDIYVEHSKFNGNQAETNGGAFYAYIPSEDPNFVNTLQLDFVDCEFSGNSAPGLGGAGYIKTSILNLLDCYFLRNTGASGGGVYVVNGDLLSDNVLFYGNEATGLIRGQHRTVVEEGYGGGIAAIDSDVSIVSSRILKNVASGASACGGGICLAGGQTYKVLDVINTLIVDNESGHQGGGLSCAKKTSVTVENCTITGNTAKAEADPANTVGCGGGIFVDHDAKVTVRRSIISGNSGYGIYEKQVGDTDNAGGVSDVAYSLFYQNAGGDLFDAQRNVSLSGSSVLESNGYTDILDSNPKFEQRTASPVDFYYLNQSESPAVDPFAMDPAYQTADQVVVELAPNGTPVTLGDMTTATSKAVDTGSADLGYHYSAETPGQYVLTAAVADSGHQVIANGGQVIVSSTGQDIPETGRKFDPGSVVPLKALIDNDYFLTGWYGGTVNDNLSADENVVLMTSDKYIEALVRLRKTLTVGTSAEYQTLGDAIDDAEAGDIIQVVPGTYVAPSQYPSQLNEIALDGKSLTISGSNPHDEAIVRATVFQDYEFELSNLNATTVIEGITLHQSEMNLTDADILIRNCVFSECQFEMIDYKHEPPIAAGTDGFVQYPIFGGAIEMYNSSPTITNCVFENNSIEGADGEDGYAGGDPHPDGGDGGWPSQTYGGAVYCGFSSKPTFAGCRFIGNQVIGASGGKGADFVTIGGVAFDGGRGGAWVYDKTTEGYLVDIEGWNGWTYEAFGNKYLSLGYTQDSSIFEILKSWFNPYAPYVGEYDFATWQRWFSWDESITSWDQYENSPPNDPYDQMLEPWRHSAYGGAVHCEFDSDATFIDCLFEDNQAHGGLTGEGGSQPENESPWPDRQLNLPTAGGAVFAAYDSDLTFERCTFRNNTADMSTVDLPHTFQTSFGGAVASKFNCDLTFTDCVLEENEATVGGGIYIHNASATIDGTTISDNTAYFGGGLFTEKGNFVPEMVTDEVPMPSVLIADSRIEGNAARPPAVVVEPVDPDAPQNNDEPVIPAATLDSTGEGGGLMSISMDLSVRDTAFLTNEAGLSGGGLRLTGTVADPVNVFNCLFAQNVAYSDGGGASVAWNTDAEFGNCTFAENRSPGASTQVETGEYIVRLDDEGQPVLGEDNQPILDPILETVELFAGSGGGLHCAYDSVVGVRNSLFWDNDASIGNQIKVGTSDEYEPHKTVLDISYSSVQNYPSANAIFRANGSELNAQNVSSINPNFEVLPDTASDDLYPRYFLDQATGCKDGGGDLASADGINLLGYTTSVTGARDKGVVDLGFHYMIAVSVECGRTDFVLDGIVDVQDLEAFAEWWLGACSEPLWCDETDLNYDGTVDMADFFSLSVCWLEEDTVAPDPNPMTWVMEPNAPSGTFDRINMIATTAVDQWWPGTAIQYYFQCLTDDTQSSLWQSESFYEVTGLNPNLSYEFVVMARDGSGNTTEASLPAGIQPGSGTEIPQAQWAVDELGNPIGEPYNTVVNPGPDALIAVGMEAMAYADIPGAPAIPGAPYSIMYQFEREVDNVTTRYAFQAGTAFVDEDVVDGQVITYHVRMALAYNGSVVDGTEGDFSPAVTITVQATDLDAPLPNPAQHVAGTPEGNYNSQTLKTQLLVRAVEATDDSGVEYMFVCSNSALSSGWRNTENVADLVYSDNSPQIPELYEVITSEVGAAGYTWTIRCRDRSPNQNETAPSVARSANAPQP